MNALFRNVPEPRKRAPDPIWDALCAALRLKPVGPRECKRVGAIVRDLRLKQIAPSEIAEQKVRYEKAFPRMLCTPEALLKHWDQLAAQAEKRKPVAAPIAPIVQQIVKPVPVLNAREQAFEAWRKSNPKEFTAKILEARKDMARVLGQLPAARVVMERVMSQVLGEPL